MGVHGCRSPVELRQGLVGVCPCFLLWDHSLWTDIMWWVLWCILRPIFLPDSQINEENGFLIAAIAGGYVCCRVLGKIHDLGEVYALPLLQQERAATQFVLKLRILIRSIVATFECRTLLEAVMNALGFKHARESHYYTREGGQSSRQKQWWWGHDYQGA